MIGHKNKIEEILLEEGRLRLDELKEAWDIQQRTGKNMEEILREENYVTARDIYKVKARCTGLEFVDLNRYLPESREVKTKVPKGLALKYTLLPIAIEDEKLKVAMKDPGNIFALDDVRIAAGMEIKPAYADPTEIKNLIDEVYRERVDTEEVIPEITPIFALDIAQEPIVTNEYPEAETLENDNISFMHKNIMGFLTDEGLMSSEQLDRVMKMLEPGSSRITDILEKEKIAEKKTVFTLLEKKTGIPCVDLTNVTISNEVISLVNVKLLRRHLAVPLEKEGTNLKVAMCDPTNIFSIDDMRLATGLEIRPVLAEPRDIEELIDRWENGGREEEEKLAPVKKPEEAVVPLLDFEEEIKKVNEEIEIEIHEDDSAEIVDISAVQNAPIVKMVNLIFSKAVRSKSSDIHIEPYEDCVLVRNRIDGQLTEVMRHDKKIHASMIARIKIISGLNIAEKRLPQDGRISIKIDNREFDMRVSILPAIFGEKAVIRLTDKEGFNMGKQELGFFEDDLEKFDEILSHPHGIILVTGPTGSGKSTTLYTALKELCKPNINILTVEDPVESTIRGINQVQVNTKAGLDFASALRAFLRQDPDIIMVGEIRDGETAEIAMRAAITGHLVLSTLHTNDACSSITRMIDMGIEPYMISSSLIGVIAQRLVRRLCPECAEEYLPCEHERAVLKIAEDEEIKIKRPKGCVKCSNTGYRGRIAIYEIMTFNNELIELVAKNANAGEIKEAALRNGMKTLRDNCSRLVLQGVTAMEELLRATFAQG